MNLARKLIEDNASVYVDSDEQRVHLVLKSQNHGNGYINFDPASVDTTTMWMLAGLLVNKLVEASEKDFALDLDDFDRVVVVTPPWGAIRLADYFTIQLQMILGVPVEMAIIEKHDDDSFFLDREGHREILQDAAVIIIEDIATKGTSTMGVIKIVHECGGTVLAIGSAWNRGGVDAEKVGLEPTEVLFFTLVDEVLPDWERPECPLCKEEVPIAIDLGKGKKFQEENPEYPGGFTALLS